MHHSNVVRKGFSPLCSSPEENRCINTLIVKIIKTFETGNNEDQIQPENVKRCLGNDYINNS